MIDAPTPEQVDAATTRAGRAAVAAEEICFARSTNRRAARSSRRTAFCSCRRPARPADDDAARRRSACAGAGRPIPSLRGVIRALQFGLLGVQGGKLTLDDMTWPLTLAADTSSRSMPASRRASPGTNWSRATRRNPMNCGASCRSRRARLFGARAGAEGHRRHPPGGRQTSISPPIIRRACG